MTYGQEDSETPRVMFDAGINYPANSPLKKRADFSDDYSVKNTPVRQTTKQIYTSSQIDQKFNQLMGNQ